MRFRFHRGGLEESLKTTIEINSIEELKSKIGNPTNIEFQHCGMDARINWDTYYVIADDKIIGMSDSNKFPKTNQQELNP